MNIDKSRIIDKTVRDIVPTFIDEVSHKTWKKLPTSTINLLSRCILRYANSYGATYQISQTKELTIISNKGKSYTLESYSKFLDLIIVDYQELKSQEQSMSNIPKYLDRRPLVGDYVERTERYNTSMDKGSIWKVTSTNSSSIGVADGRGYWDSNRFKIINPDHSSHPNYQEPQLKIKVGTHWERLKDFKGFGGYKAGEIVTLTKVTETYVNYSDSRGKSIEDFLKTFKPRPDLTSPDTKRGLAFYKESGANWTADEYQTIINYCRDTNSSIDDCKEIARNKNKYIYDDGSSINFMHYWSGRSPEFYPENFTIHSYESIFCKPKPVASEKEANPKPTKNENTFMSKIKASASATVDQNKQALVIASKMEAGRIINKQVLKQLTPHLPFFLQGYAKSPFAPFVAANLVAMVANHTGNSKLTKVSDLMLLGAADSGVAAFNLDKIVDDILSNIKLPAGILDDNDDN